MNFSTSSDQIFLDQEQEKTKRIGIDSEMDAYQTVMFFAHILHASMIDWLHVYE